MRLLFPLLILCASAWAPLMAQNLERISIRVDAKQELGPLRPIYSFFGYDEPNYTYMKDGKKLLSQLAAASPVPVYVRVHNLLTTGDGTAALKWGSTNAYTERADGKPHYDWTIVDRIFETLLERRMKPLVEIGFMPEALSVKPQPYRHNWAPEQQYRDIFTGWAYPPKDYGKWSELIYQWVRHSVEKYGKAEVESWYWEVWNEPNIGYWQGTPGEYHKLYDYSVAAVKRALPTARVGGPHSTGPGSEQAAKFLRDFLEHVVRGKNYATGHTGSPIDYVGFHAKGSPKVVEGHVQMGISNQLRSVARGFEIVASFPELKSLPIIIGESDPEGCAACSVRFHPQNGYRNGTMYSSYTAASFARKHDLAARHQINFEGAVTWAFEFEDQPYFDGFRDLSSNGMGKPVPECVSNVWADGGQRVAVQSSGAGPGNDSQGWREGQTRRERSREPAGQSVEVMVWNYHDDDLPAASAAVGAVIKGLPQTDPISHYRVDKATRTSYEVWKQMGSPQKPSPEQYAQLDKASELQLLKSPEWLHSTQGRLTLNFNLPRQGVSLLKLTW